jgi:hypothetical protein
VIEEKEIEIEELECIVAQKKIKKIKFVITYIRS